MPHLETERLILREWRGEDREPFARINSDPMVMEFLPRILDREDSDKLVERFQQHFKKHGYGLFVLEHKETGQFMGFVGLNHVEFKAPFTPAVEIAWRLDYDCWGHGYATEAAKRILDYAFNDLKLKEIVSFTVHDHERSMHIMEKIGMSRVEGGDFDYPMLPKGHPLGRFVLYELTRKDYLSQA